MLWLGLATSLAFIPGITGAAIPTGWAVLSCILPLALWRKVELTILHWAFGLFLLYAGIAQLWNVGFNGPWALWQLSLIGLAFWLGSSINTGAKLYTGLAIGTSASSILAIAQHFGFAWVKVFNVPEAGLFFNSMALGLACAILILTLYIERLYWYIPALVPGLYLSHSRGALAVLGAGLFLTYVRQPIWLITVFVGIILTVFLHLTVSDLERLYIWQAAWSHLTTFGWGPGSFLDLFIRTNQRIIHPEFVHNEILQLTFELGVGALPFFMWLAFASATPSARDWPIFCASLVAITFSPAFHIPVLALVLGLSAGRCSCDWPVARVSFIHCRPIILSWLHRPWQTNISLEPRTQNTESLNV